MFVFVLMVNFLTLFKSIVRNSSKDSINAMHSVTKIGHTNIKGL